VGPFVSGVSSAVSSGLPTDEELEREVKRDRERSWREVEQILTQGVEERRLVEGKVLAMLNIATTPKHVSSAHSQSMRPPHPVNPSTLYRFTDQGSLDVPCTLLAIAPRFEKLKKWTVGHFRALEERMSDVGREGHPPWRGLNEMRNELMDDEDDDGDASDAEEEDSVDRSIGRSMCWHAFAHHKKCQRNNGV
jgi:hypothetical protein